jgi:hypothetical protein
MQTRSAKQGTVRSGLRVMNSGTQQYVYGQNTDRGPSPGQWQYKFYYHPI